jgi:glycosidase
MLYFLENHDEQRIASNFFAGDGNKAVPALIVAALLEQNPFMLYAGQEYGERGMDEEGFSGCDGRTTIFDYWSVDTLVRAAEGKLTDEEQTLNSVYCKVLAIAGKEKTESEGHTFDLMYANRQNGAQYFFLRGTGREQLLIAVNFDDVPAEVSVTIPGHAFDYLALKEGDYAATDLLTGQQKVITLKRDGQVQITIEPRGGVVLKF